jgi:hypothetical protein
MSNIDSNFDLKPINSTAMKLFAAFILMVFPLTISAQKEKAVLSHWRSSQSGDLKIEDSEYGTAKKGAVLYYISNDDNNLYVDMKVKETLEQNHILQLGMTVWINMDGKARKEMGVRFPIGSQYSRRGGRGSTPDINPPTPLSQANTIELVGFKGVEQNRFPSDNTDNIRGSVKYDNDGNLVYRLIIPLVKLPMRNDASSTAQLPFTLGIEYGAPPVMTGQMGQPSGMPSSNMRRGSGSTGGSRGGSGGAPAGGMPAGGGGRPSAAQSAVTPVIIWAKEIVLSEKK